MTFPKVLAAVALLMIVLGAVPRLADQATDEEARYAAIRDIHVGRAEEEWELARHRLSEHRKYAGPAGSIVMSESG